jgi:hypothetical protein
MAPIVTRREDEFLKTKSSDREKEKARRTRFGEAMLHVSLS